ncbi:MAG: four helix bundle protein [Candidatus Moraniibacteriota bacterium]
MAELLNCFKTMDKKYLQLNNVSAYKVALNLSNKVWDIVVNKEYFIKNTVGIQFVRSLDSISANIAEGFGRYSKKDKIKFYRYSFGSVKESLDWNEKAMNRKIISEKEYKFIFTELQKLPRSINYLIKYTNEKLKQ